MFQPLIDLIFKIGNILVNGLNALIESNKKFAWALMAFGITAVVFIKKIIVIVSTMFLQLIETLTSLVSNISINQIDFSTVNEWLSIANTFIPLQEMLALLSALSALWVIALTYRLIKSYIPTLS